MCRIADWFYYFIVSISPPLCQFLHQFIESNQRGFTITSSAQSQQTIFWQLFTILIFVTEPVAANRFYESELPNFWRSMPDFLNCVNCVRVWQWHFLPIPITIRPVWVVGGGALPRNRLRLAHLQFILKKCFLITDRWYHIEWTIDWAGRGHVSSISLNIFLINL